MGDDSFGPGGWTKKSLFLFTWGEFFGLTGVLFELFVAEVEEKIADFDRVCAEQDVAAFRKIVHFIAGSAGNLGSPSTRWLVFYVGLSMRLMTTLSRILSTAVLWSEKNLRYPARLLRANSGLEAFSLLRKRFVLGFQET